MIGPSKLPGPADGELGGCVGLVLVVAGPAPLLGMYGWAVERNWLPADPGPVVGAPLKPPGAAVFGDAPKPLGCRGGWLALTTGGLAEPCLWANPCGLGLCGGEFWQPLKATHAATSKLVPIMDLNAIAYLLDSLRLLARGNAGFAKPVFSTREQGTIPS